MNERDIKKIIVELLRKYRESEVCVAYNMSGDPEADIKELDKEITEYLFRAKEALKQPKEEK